jgi:hypothetical protein
LTPDLLFLVNYFPARKQISTAFDGAILQPSLLRRSFLPRSSAATRTSCFVVMILADGISNVLE